MSAVEGMNDPRFAAVRDAFAANFAERGEVGAAVAVTIDGRPVVDLWGGEADAAEHVPWRRDTLVNVFSVGKGFVTLAALVLCEREALDPDDRVERHWPEFAAHGKQDVTVRQVLCHQAGLPAIRDPLPDDAMMRWRVMTDALAAESPWWPPGTRHGYHVNTFGFLVGEIVRRIAGKSLGRFLRDEIAGPLDADVHIGVDGSDERRVAAFVWPGLEEQLALARIAPTDDAQRMLNNTYFNPLGFSGHGVVNTSAWRRAEIPSANAHATARGVARLYSALALGGTLDGVAIVGQGVLAEATTEQACGRDAILGRTTRFGLGFQLPHAERPIGPHATAFGHFGAGGALGFADPEARLAFGYVMNRMGPRFQNPTTRSLVDAVYACL